MLTDDESPGFQPYSAEHPEDGIPPSDDAINAAKQRRIESLLETALSVLEANWTSVCEELVLSLFYELFEHAEEEELKDAIFQGVLEEDPHNELLKEEIDALLHLLFWEEAPADEKNTGKLSEYFSIYVERCRTHHFPSHLEVMLTSPSGPGHTPREPSISPSARRAETLWSGGR